LEKILRIALFGLLASFIASCEFNTADVSYSKRAGSELMSFVSPDIVVDKKGVFVFQLESKNDDSVSYYDSETKGVDVATINFKEKFKYRYRIGNVDSVRVKLIDPNGNELFNLQGPNQSVEYTANSGKHKLIVENLRNSKGIRKIFSKPDYDTIRTLKIYNVYNDVIYSILEEDDCEECSLINVNLQGYNLDSVNFSNADFQNADLNGANLSYSILNYSNFLSTKVDSANISYALLDKPRNLRLASFYYTNAKGITIRDADLDNTVMWDCDMSHSTITGSRMDNTDFFACNIKHSNLTNNLFENSSLEDCILDSSDITGTSFCNSVLNDVSFYYTKGDETTKCVPDTARGTW
jgi:uncharacterized protein YjbI with pentapeptide repeats